jgi:hypothetical protein
MAIENKLNILRREERLKAAESIKEREEKAIWDALVANDWRVRETIRFLGLFHSSWHNAVKRHPDIKAKLR